MKNNQIHRVPAWAEKRNQKSIHHPPFHSISFLIPTLNKTDLLEKCLSSIDSTCIREASDGVSFEVIVIQDGKSQEVTERLSRLRERYSFRHLQTGGLQGYTKTMNIGLQAASGDLLILLNDDISFEQHEWLSLIHRTFALDARVGIVGCRLLYPDRRIQHGGMFYAGGVQLLGHRYWGMPEDTPAARKVHRTVAMTGALLAVRREMLHETGLLDENLRMLCSDTDLCLTAHQKGWQVIYNGRAYALHDESQTRRQLSGSMPLDRLESGDLIRFYRKWHAALKLMHLQKMI